MSDLFVDKNIDPMLLSQTKTPFDSEEYIFELKLDGIRCLAYLDNKTTQLQNKRFKILNETYPELAELHKQVKEKCILDGELIYINKLGVPDFQTLQARSLVSDPFKIKIKANQFPVSFVAYDIIYYKNKNITHLSLMERKKILNDVVIENKCISLSRYIENSGKALFKATTKQGLEGIVAKLKTSTYQIGKRSNDWIKIKNLVDEDFYICGYMLDKKKNIKDLILCKNINNKFIYESSIFFGVRKYEQKTILEFAQNNKSKTQLFEGLNESIVWIKPQLQCTIEYMHRTKSGSKRQPVYKGLVE